VALCINRATCCFYTSHSRYPTRRVWVPSCTFGGKQAQTATFKGMTGTNGPRGFVNWRNIPIALIDRIVTWKSRAGPKVCCPIPVPPASTAAPIATGWSDPVPGRVFPPAVVQRLSRRTVHACLHQLTWVRCGAAGHFDDGTSTQDSDQSGQSKDNRLYSIRWVQNTNDWVSKTHREKGQGQRTHHLRPQRRR